LFFFFGWRLLLICGAGWLADNAWMQVTSSIIPIVKKEFSVRKENKTKQKEKFFSFNPFF
jgi:hypothetical protein